MMFRALALTARFAFITCSLTALVPLGACDDGAPNDDDDDDDDDDDGGEGEGEGEGELPVPEEARALCEIVTRGQLVFISAIAGSFSSGVARCTASESQAFPDPEAFADTAAQACADDANPTVQEFARGLAGGRVTFNLPNIAACAALDLAELSGEGATGVPAACLPENLFTGTVPEGSSCAQEWDCADALLCQAADLHTQALTCLPPAAVGDDCLDSAPGSGITGVFANGRLPPRTCEANATCVDFVCEAKAGVGDPCSSSSDCADDLGCDDELDVPVCFALGDIGDPCDFASDCLEDLACADNVCAAEIADGAACGAGDACAETCSTCRPSTPGGAVTTCQDRGAAGAGCASTNDCRHGFVCDVDTCAPGGTAGDLCNFSSEECAAGFVCGLDGTECIAQPAAGDPCSDATTTECADSTCVDGTCRAGVAGDPCDSDDVCQDGLVCSAAAQECAAAPTSGPCSVDGQCADDFVCDVDACVAEPDLGDACLSEGRCGTGAYCDADVCVAQKGAGAACASDIECNTACLAGECSAEGASCTTSKSFFPLFVILSVALPLRRLRRRV